MQVSEEHHIFSGVCSFPITLVVGELVRHATEEVPDGNTHRTGFLRKAKARITLTCQ
jgi:hypothetical protein